MQLEVYKIMIISKEKKLLEEAYKSIQAKNGYLHDDASKPLQDATTAELKNSIDWYRKTIQYWSQVPHMKPEGLIAQCKRNLGVCEAEYASRIGRAAKK